MTGGGGTRRRSRQGISWSGCSASRTRCRSRSWAQRASGRRRLPPPPSTVDCSPRMTSSRASLFSRRHVSGVHPARAVARVVSGRRDVMRTICSSRCSSPTTAKPHVLRVVRRRCVRAPPGVVPRSDSAADGAGRVKRPTPIGRGARLPECLPESRRQPGAILARRVGHTLDRRLGENSPTLQPYQRQCQVYPPDCFPSTTELMLPPDARQGILPSLCPSVVLVVTTLVSDAIPETRTPKLRDAWREWRRPKPAAGSRRSSRRAVRPSRRHHPRRRSSTLVHRRRGPKAVRAWRMLLYGVEEA